MNCKNIKSIELKVNSNLILNEGDTICDICNGIGMTHYQKDANWHEYKVCKKCGGTRKVNWIENIFGKQEIIRIDVPDFRSKFDEDIIIVNYMDILLLNNT